MQKAINRVIICSNERRTLRNARKTEHNARTWIELASSSNGYYVPLASILKGFVCCPPNRPILRVSIWFLQKTLIGFPKRHQDIEFCNRGGVLSL